MSRYCSPGVVRRLDFVRTRQPRPTWSRPVIHDRLLASLRRTRQMLRRRREWRAASPSGTRRPRPACVQHTGAPLNIEGVQRSQHSVRRANPPMRASASSGSGSLQCWRSVTRSSCARCPALFVSRLHRREIPLLARSDIPAASRVPVLRLVWRRWTVRSRRRHRDRLATARRRGRGGLLAAMRSEAVDLALLDAPALESIRIGDDEFRRTQRAFSAGVDARSRSVELAAISDPAGSLAGSCCGRACFPSRVRRAARPHSLRRTLAPCAPDRRCRMRPDRRRVLPGARIAELAAGYSGIRASAARAGPDRHGSSFEPPGRSAPSIPFCARPSSRRLRERLGSGPSATTRWPSPPAQPCFRASPVNSQVFLP